MVSTSCYPVILLSVCANSNILPLSMANASHRCCRSPLLKYRVRYGRSRHRCRFRYFASDMLGGMLLCRQLLHERWSWSHRSHCCRSAKWGAVNVFSPNTPALVLLRQYRHRTRRQASLLPSSSSALTTIRIFFFVPIVWPLYLISDHIHRVSAHRHPPCL